MDGNYQEHAEAPLATQAEINEGRRRFHLLLSEIQRIENDRYLSRRQKREAIRRAEVVLWRAGVCPGCGAPARLFRVWDRGANGFECEACR